MKCQEMAVAGDDHAGVGLEGTFQNAIVVVVRNP
jgi:hypothetical protein